MKQKQGLNKAVKNPKFLYLCIITLLILIIILLVSRCDNETEQVNTSNSGIEWDENAKELGTGSIEDTVARLNEMVEAGMIRISIEPSPSISKSDSECKINIYNHPTNLYPQIVEIRLDETNEVIYKSKAIPVGSGIETIKIDLPEGIHECTAYFSAINSETGEIIGTAGAKLKLTVGG